MLKELKNKKGFTLIELLAAIVILGVLMMVAIPAMTKYIENAKRDVFADTAKKYIAAVRYSMLSNSYECKVDSTSGADIRYSCGLADLDADASLYLIVPASLIDVENETKTSPWGKPFNGSTAYVLVKNVGDELAPKYEYYFAGVDTLGNGISVITEETEIGRSSVRKSGVSIYNLNFENNNGIHTKFREYCEKHFGQNVNLKFVAGVK